ncbi:NAD(P)/FAD-dependent oxidoreductase [Shimia sp. FJ5]|uniref:NAD(P)/FAD-dependent oxidoreductase n=1 Tax=Shimia sp. FJ5 TaxID=3079054 RepID=UPI002628F432|nr:FAD-dependent oxidoreductase [Shimia sp. FJ5]MDV4144516.1 FAD-dependent oxidoreductase [Shimia sp. FJ5]
MVDVTVMGAGAFGLSVAWSCVKRGASVRVVDRYGLGSGSSGGTVGALSPHTPENWNDKKEFQFQSLIMAEDYWSEIEDVSGLRSGYGRVGRLQPVMNARGLELAHAREDTARDLWRGKAAWRVIEAAEAGDWAPLTPTGYLIHDTLSARMSPRMACTALAAALRAKDTEIVSNTAENGKVVWATGWRGLVDLSEEMGRMVGNGVKGQSALLRLSRPDAPQLYADAVHIIPHVDGTVAIGSTSERDFDAPDTTDALLDEVIARAFAAVPALEGAEVIERWAGVRPRAKSRAPMLGAHPTKPGQFIANGGFKIGFGMAPKVGEVMADLILDGEDNIPEPFKPEASL